MWKRSHYAWKTRSLRSAGEWRVLRPSESAVERLPRPFRLQVAHHGDRLSMASQYNVKRALPGELAVKH
jgi:hypothetical protein